MLRNTEVPDSQCLTILGPGRYELSSVENIDLEHPFDDIEEPEGVGATLKKSHTAIRDHVCTKILRTAVLHEVNAGRLSEVKAAKCVRGFFALLRWVLRKTGIGGVEYKKVGNDMGFVLWGYLLCPYRRQ